ncbi:MAG TPA: hypothetical protein VF310_11955 [Vicinamibacteria bacterium]|jgi:hypothetical protein
MKPNRKSLAGRALALAVLAACFVSAPARSSVAAAAPTLPQMRPIGDCEGRLAACMNGGGDTDTCWNAYWRCISR